MKYNHTFLVLALSGLTVFTACKKDTKKPTDENPPVDNPAPPTYTIPSTYDFGTNMSFKTSTQRVAMFKELIAYIRTTHNATTNISISSANLLNMYGNSGSPFADGGSLGLNASGISLKEKTNNTYNAIAELEAILNEAAATSQGTASGSDGVAGKVLGPAPTTTSGTQPAWLFDKNGFEYKELVEKGGMGAILYSEAMTILKKIDTYDNTNVIADQGTAMEHAWDEAFGYFTVPVSFPTNTTGLSYWGSYCNAVNTAIGSNATILNAWLKGRAAISNKDYTARNEARDIVVSTWEKIGAARFITYMKQAKTNFAIDGQRNHALSEGVGFVKAFRYNPAKKISEADINELLGYIGTNLYQISTTNIDAAINKMATVFNLDASKL
jgi:hypothetical protein